jgi:A/G-specific adenine glycosylase
VLHLWTGLGYYARARNLHRGPQLIRDQHGRRVPQAFDDIVGAAGRRPIDGRAPAWRWPRRAARHSRCNVKACSCAALRGRRPADDNATLEKTLASSRSEHAACRSAIYTQAIMDLGADAVYARKPRCADCPIATDCRARASRARRNDMPPARRKRAPRRLRRAVMLVARHASAVLLVQRPASGIWGGLWCLPEFDDRDAPNISPAASCRARGWRVPRCPTSNTASRTSTW